LVLIMKVALILTGSVRNLHDTYHSIKYYFLDRFQELDIFVYGCENNMGRDQNLKFIFDFLRPKKAVINSYTFYTPKLGRDIVSDKKTFYDVTEKSIWAYFNVMMANKMRKDYEIENDVEYDLIIRSRMDLFWFRHITDQEIEHSKNNILVPWDWAFRSGYPWNGPNPLGYSDFYCITNSELFDYYANVYSYISEFSNSLSYHSESVLGYYLKDKPVIEVPKHVMNEYPIVERNGMDSNGDVIPDPYYHPKIWSGIDDFGTCDIQKIGRLRLRYDF